MNLPDIVEHLYLPLLTQETAVMVSVFTYGLRAGAGAPLLVGVNTAAVATDLILFFVPAHLLSQRLEAKFGSKLHHYHDMASRFVARFGSFRASLALAYVLPSVAAMIVIGVLRLSFWRALAGLFLGSTIYVVPPLLLSAPLAPILPAFVVPLLPWVAPSLAVAVILVYLVRLRWG
ncbi:MAG: hypothetical protein ACR2JC_19120 [Chloroflexota bacterium]